MIRAIKSIGGGIIVCSLFSCLTYVGVDLTLERGGEVRMEVVYRWGDGYQEVIETMIAQSGEAIFLPKVTVKGVDLERYEVRKGQVEAVYRFVDVAAFRSALSLYEVEIQERPLGRLTMALPGEGDTAAFLPDFFPREERVRMEVIVRPGKKVRAVSSGEILEKGQAAKMSIFFGEDGNPSQWAVTW